MMNEKKSKAWWLARAKMEQDAPLTVGLVHDEALSDAPAQRGVEQESARLALGKLVNLLRRNQGLSINQLSELASVDVSELLLIEESVDHVPSPRTVYQLSRQFDVPQLSLMELAGLAANDIGLKQEAVRFAASSESFHELNSDERAALAAFIAVLSQRGKSRSGEERPG
jgi:transcriptional regulator with XRE-family HTH domain